MRLTLLIACAASLMVSAIPSYGAGTCRPDRGASFELRADWYGGVYMPVRIGDTRMNLLVDTGGATSMLTNSTVAALGLNPQPLQSQRVTMYGGKRLNKFVTIGAVQIGNLDKSPTTFLVMPDDRIPNELSGTLAPDFLSHYDVDFDFANARMNLFAPGRCANGAVYWTDGPAASIPIGLDNVHHIILPVSVDGKTIMAFLDTGSSRSDLTLETAQTLFGLTRSSPGMHPASGPDAEDGLYSYPFKSLSLGGTTVNNPDLVLVPERISRRSSAMPKLVLGMSILRHYHVYIAYRDHMLYLTPASAH